MDKNFKVAREQVRADFIRYVTEALTERGDEVLRVGSNEISIPCVSGDEDDFIVITFKMPTGSRDGDPYDGYAAAEDYSIKLRQKADKAAKAQAIKEKKIERDRKYREAKAAAKEKRGQ